MRRRVLIVMTAGLLIAAACGDGDTAADTTTTAPGATTLPGDTTTVAAGGTPADLAITEVTFDADGHVTITNLGAGVVSTEGLWVCNRPTYVELSGESLEPGQSITIPISDLGIRGPEQGEVALYLSSSFSSADDIIDYVAFGNGGGRGSVAADAGIWPEGATVEADGAAAITAAAGGDEPADWTVS